jgi:subtilase family serine protease
MIKVGPRRVATLLALAGFWAGTTFAGATALPPGYAASVPHAYGLRDLGRATGATRVQLAVVLKFQHEAELDQLIERQGDPDSPLFARFLTPAEFDRYFAPSQAAYARTIGALQRAGFTITHTFVNRLIVDVESGAPVAERYFSTEIHRVVVPGQGLRYENARSAFLPSELRGDVAGVVGLTNIEWFHTTNVVLPRQPLPRLPGGDVVIGPPLHGPAGGFGPLAWAQGYDLPVQHRIPGKPKKTTYDGAGRTAGIVIPADPSDSDLGHFLSFFMVTRTGTTNRIHVDGPGPCPSCGADLEAALDYQTIAGAAPGATIDVYEPNDFASKTVVDTYNQIAVDNTADTVNNSFSACETSSFFDPHAMYAAIKQGTAQGQRWHGSTGDSGQFTFQCSFSVSVGTPSDIPIVAAIGGTSLQVDSNGNYVSESFWNNSTGAGGGGVSVVFKTPPWQKFVPNIVKSGRNSPDVSFAADPFTGEDIYVGASGGFFTVGGTSLASPIFGACDVEMEQVFGRRFTNFFPRLYRHWLKQGYGTELHDITTGTPAGPLVPGPGYDLATGIGSADCYNLVTKLL